MRLRVRSLPLLSGLTIRRCRELWWRSQPRLGSRVAVTLAKAGWGVMLGAARQAALDAKVRPFLARDLGEKGTHGNRQAAVYKYCNISTNYFSQGHFNLFKVLPHKMLI